MRKELWLIISVAIFFIATLLIWYRASLDISAPAHVPKAIPSEVYKCYKCGDTICDYGSGFCEKCFGDDTLKVKTK